MCTAHENLCRNCDMLLAPGTTLAEHECRGTPESRLLARLQALRDSGDPEAAHADADEALLDFIATKAWRPSAIRDAFEAITRWYA